MKNIKREIAMKVSKAHVPPIWDENVCDSTNGKQIFVRFAITISAVPTLEVTRLLDILLQCSEFNDDVLSISYRKVLILSLPT